MVEVTETTLIAMNQYGGLFVKSLSKCYRHADPGNKQKLLETFKSFFEEYIKKAEVMPKYAPKQ